MSTAASSRRLLTVQEVAARLGVSEKTVRRRIADGLLPAVQLGHYRHALRVDAAELDDWLETRRTTKDER